MKKIVLIGSKFGELCRELTASFERRGCDVSFFAAQELWQAAGIKRSLPPISTGAESSENPLGRTDGASRKGMLERSGAELQTNIFAEADAAVIRGIPAGSLEEVIFRMDALYTEESKGLLFVNSPKAIEKTVDKFLTTALLEKEGLPVPPTLCVPAEAERIRSAFFELGEDAVYKPLFGSCGSGLVRLQSEAAIDELADRLKAEGRIAYLQKFIPCGNSDIRAFVIGGRVIAAMTRKGRDWRANLTLGGIAEIRKLSAEEEEFALRAAAAVGADVAGVDIILDKEDKPYVIEVNGCPGWKGLSEVTGIDVAGELADYVIGRMTSF